MMDAGITTVKIKCQDAVGYLAVYRYRTDSVQCTYLLQHGTYYVPVVVGPQHLSTRPMILYRCQNSDFIIKCYNVRVPGTTGMDKV